MTGSWLLIRHGQSEANAGLSNDPDCSMTPTGFEQARAAARKIAALDLQGYSARVSPYRRTVQTAAEIAAVTGWQFDVDDRLREWGDVATINGRDYPKESMEELLSRLSDFRNEMAQRKLVIVSHASPIALLTQLAWNEPPYTGKDFWMSVANAGTRWVKVVSGHDRDV